MAITIWKPTERPASLANAFAVDPTLLQSRAAQEARRKGVLLAKEQALRAAEGLLRWGRLLSWGVVFVSAIHIWESVASIAPAEAGHLTLPPMVYHLAALAFTLMIDAIALFVGRANAVAELAGVAGSRWAGYFYAVTALLNAAFVASHAPALEDDVRAQILPALGMLFVVILPATVPAGIIAVEQARRALEISRLTLIAEVAELRELVAAPRVTGRQNASSSVLAVDGPPSRTEDLTVSSTGGRPQQFRVEELVARMCDRQTFAPADAQRALGASESSVRRLLAEGQERGLITRRDVGVYAVASPEESGVARR